MVTSICQSKYTKSVCEYSGEFHSAVCWNCQRWENFNPIAKNQNVSGWKQLGKTMRKKRMKIWTFQKLNKLENILLSILSFHQSKVTDPWERSGNH